MDRIDRPFVAAEASVARLECLWSWRESGIEQEKLEPKEPEPLLKPGDSCKTIEELDHYLLNKKGVNGTPLAYLFRDHVVPTEDLGFGQPTITDELIMRACHAGYSDYEVDNNYCWNRTSKTHFTRSLH
jgi:hypothetical protein